MSGQEFIDTKEVAEFLDVPERTVLVWRTKKTGTGPPFAKFGRHVRYRRSDLEAWVNAKLRDAAGVS